MKALLLMAVSVLACLNSVFAQNLPPDYLWEVGINAGYSNMVRPTGPAEAYQGNRTKGEHDYSIRLNYYASEHWMLNFDAGTRHWATYGSWQINDQMGQQLKTRDVTFVMADHAVDESVGINYVIPFYTRYNNFNRANLYFGVMVGLMQTVNDGSMGYSRYNSAPDSTLMYMSKYDYNAGNGYNVGIQLGYTWYIIPRLGLNIDLGVRYAHIKTNDSRYGSENSKYYLLYFPETLGLRWRF